MKRFASLLALVLAACTSPVAPVAVDASLNGTWTSDAPGSFVRGLSITVDSAQVGTRAVAQVRDCPTEHYIYACQLNGFVIESSSQGANVSVTVTFANAPVGLTVTGRLYEDGTLRGTVDVRANTDRRAPVEIVLRRR